MKQTLFKLKNYGAITFVSTSHALKAERVLKNASAEFLMMPTPREISTSCGLAIKVASDELHSNLEILKQNQVRVDGAYQIKTVNGKAQAERVSDA